MQFTALSYRGLEALSHLEAILKNLLTDDQIRVLRFCFKLRIQQMKDGKLDHDFYVESGKFEEDLEDARIDHPIDRDTFTFIDQIFKDELIKSSFNHEIYLKMGIKLN